MFEAVGFEREVSNGGRRIDSALALILGDLTDGRRCCESIRSASLAKAIAEEGCGLVIYEYQEGRGIGLTAKLKAYELQDAGLDIIDAGIEIVSLVPCEAAPTPDSIAYLCTKKEKWGTR
jgi:GTP cyclohydrolase II